LLKKTRGDRIIEWIETHCYVPEGKFLGRLVVLTPWQKALIKAIYDNPAGTRRAIISFGRKNGKTSLAAFLLLTHLAGPAAERNSQLYSTAQSREQAGYLFALAAKIVRSSPELRNRVHIREHAKELFCVEFGTRYRALSAEASTAYGLSPTFVVHDELGQVRGRRWRSAARARDRAAAVLMAAESAASGASGASSHIQRIGLLPSLRVGRDARAIRPIWKVTPLAPLIGFIGYFQ
jgi:phage terminase large subunit-like protein